MRCEEQKLSKQNDMIRTPISDLGCEQAPAGCEVEKNDDFASISSGSAGGKNEQQYLDTVSIISWMCLKHYLFSIC